MTIDGDVRATIEKLRTQLAVLHAELPKNNLVVWPGARARSVGHQAFRCRL
jgi:hypothetical protein